MIDDVGVDPGNDCVGRAMSFASCVIVCLRPASLCVGTRFSATSTKTFTQGYEYTRDAPQANRCYLIRGRNRIESFSFIWHHVGWGPLPNAMGVASVNLVRGVVFDAPAPTPRPRGGCR